MADPPFYVWLEPAPASVDLDQGFRARVADPAWFLARQWQLGEHRGEDASSPVTVAVTAAHVPLTYDPDHPELDPTVVPAEALVEGGPDDWWTVGRRARLGRAAAGPLAAAGVADLTPYRFAALPEPYDHLEGELDGLAVFRSRVVDGDPLWAQVPGRPPDAWSPGELSFAATFQAGGQDLTVRDHEGGDVDWFTVDGPGGDAMPEPPEPPPTRTVLSGRLDYPGAPNPRWWQIEDRQVDIGGFAPDRSHLGTMLLLDVALAHADDWFSFPVPPPVPPEADVAPPPSSGVVVTLHEAVVRDSFDQEWPLATPPPDGPGGWSLFRTAGLDRASLVVWPVAVAPRTGPLLDEVLIGIDEDANLAWAVELRADGRPLLEDASTTAAEAQTRHTGSREFAYLPSTTLPRGWHPYRRTDPDRMGGDWEQGLVADLTQVPVVPRPGPASSLIGGPSGDGAGGGHVIRSTAMASSGVRLQRRAVLARDTDARPVLWVQRSAVPLTGPPTSHLRFDVLAEAEKA